MNEEMKHTPEPWGVCSPLDRFPGIEAHSVRSSIVIYGEEDEDAGVRGETQEHSLANARRIVAAVNGCKGIPDPETTVPEMVALIQEYVDEADCGDGGEHPADFDITSCWHCNSTRILAKLKPTET